MTIETAVIIAIVSLIGSILSGTCQIISKIRSSSCTANGCSMTREQNNIEIEVNSEGHLERVSIPSIEKNNDN